jgi:hypothetical protein
VDGKSAVMHWLKNKKMDELMDFLSCYVRNVHADRYFRKLLLNNLGCTYLDIITPSDIAYIISVIKNSAHLWLQKRGDACGKMEMENVTLKPLFTVGQKKKRTFGVTTWNKLVIEYGTIPMHTRNGRTYSPRQIHSTLSFEIIGINGLQTRERNLWWVLMLELKRACIVYWVQGRTET